MYKINKDDAREMSDEWYANKERPPIGEKVYVTATRGELGSRLAVFSGKDVEVVGVFEADSRAGVVVYNRLYGVIALIFTHGIVRPIKPDRDKTIDAAMKLCDIADHEYERKTIKYYAAQWYDAGLLSLPEEK